MREPTKEAERTLTLTAEEIWVAVRNRQLPALPGFSYQAPFRDPSQQAMLLTLFERVWLARRLALREGATWRLRPEVVRFFQPLRYAERVYYYAIRSHPMEGDGEAVMFVWSRRFGGLLYTMLEPGVFHFIQTSDAQRFSRIIWERLGLLNTDDAHNDDEPSPMVMLSATLLQKLRTWASTATSDDNTDVALQHELQQRIGSAVLAKRLLDTYRAFDGYHIIAYAPAQRDASWQSRILLRGQTGILWFMQPAAQPNVWYVQRTLPGIARETLQRFLNFEE